MFINFFLKFEPKLSLFFNPNWITVKYKDIYLVGDNNFISSIKNIIDHLETNDSLNFNRVNKWIEYLIYSPEQKGLSISSKHQKCFVGKNINNYFNIDWFCCSLVHEATHAMLYHKYNLKKIKPKYREEYLCTKAKLIAYQRLGYCDFNIDEELNKIMKIKWYTKINKLKKIMRDLK